MNATRPAPSVQAKAGAIVSVDLAKNVSSCAWPTPPGAARETQRLSATSSSAGSANRAVSRVVSRGLAHHWARWLTGLGIQVTLLPRALRARLRPAQQTDAADAAVLLEAALRCAELHPVVRIKSVEQQACRLHCTRSLWQADACARRINTPARPLPRSSAIAIARAAPGSSRSPACWRTALRHP